ncbi:FecR family protein [Nitrospira sp. KM1]|uniref:FecR family protein n=1 Tax=Nitrospira sp. KM1 TaxID=1936990 RepID=UPI0015665ABC|nr:FecR family protein [Nitrospira sp. KM1]
MSPDSDSQKSSRPTDDDHAIAEEAARWFVRLRAQDISTDERRAFERWRAQRSLHDRAYREICDLWNDAAFNAASIQSEEEGSHASSRFPFRIWRRSNFTRYLAAAAIAGLLIVLGLQFDLPLLFTAEYRTATGDRRVISLPDQSLVTLNTHSAISTDFLPHERRIHLLSGEAHFKVHSDERRPFVVDHHHIHSRAVGTSFVVREEAQGIRLTVAEGVVELSPREGSWNSLQVTAGQQVLVDQDGPGPIRPVDIHAVTGWMRGRLVFDNVSLEQVVTEIRRYHNGLIILWNPALANIRVSGSYNLSDTTAILTTLTQTLPIHLTRLTDRLVILF